MRNCKKNGKKQKIPKKPYEKKNGKILYFKKMAKCNKTKSLKKMT